MTSPSSAPVFVVGGPRSGTTLLSAMLAAHSAFDCGPETHCLSRWSRLARSERERILDPADWPERATAFVASLSLGKKPIYPMYGLERARVPVDQSSCRMGKFGGSNPANQPGMSARQAGLTCLRGAG